MLDRHRLERQLLAESELELRRTAIFWRVLIAEYANSKAFIAMVLTTSTTKQSQLVELRRLRIRAQFEPIRQRN